MHLSTGVRMMSKIFYENFAHLYIFITFLSGRMKQHKLSPFLTGQANIKQQITRQLLWFVQPAPIRYQRGYYESVSLYSSIERIQDIVVLVIEKANDLSNVGQIWHQGGYEHYDWNEQVPHRVGTALSVTSMQKSVRHSKLWQYLIQKDDVVIIG